MAKKVVERHDGNIEAVKDDPEYLKCQAAFKDFSSTLAEKEGRCAELEADIETLEKNVAGHKVQLESLRRELDKISQEKHEAVADMITAKEEKQLADMIAGHQRGPHQQGVAGDARPAARERRPAPASPAKWPAPTPSGPRPSSSNTPPRRQADNEFDKLIGLAQRRRSPSGR